MHSAKSRSGSHPGFNTLTLHIGKELGAWVVFAAIHVRLVLIDRMTRSVLDQLLLVPAINFDKTYSVCQLLFCVKSPRCTRPQSRHLDTDAQQESRGKGASTRSQLLISCTAGSCCRIRINSPLPLRLLLRFAIKKRKHANCCPVCKEDVNRAPNCVHVIVHTAPVNGG